MKRTDPGWVSSKITRSDAVVWSQYCPDRPYLELEIPPGTKQVRRIVFTTDSHDQGFSGDNNNVKGTYNATYSWFEVALITPSGHDRVHRMNLQNNLHAVFKRKRHINIWDDRGSSPEVSRFLQAIHAGDVVAIVPKARHLAWRNYVYEAEIEVFVEQEDPLALSVMGLNRKVRSLELGSPTVKTSSIYRQLGTTPAEIRLIEIKSGSFHDDIVCGLRYARLGDPGCVSYDALSYCWGDANDVRSITVRDIGSIKTGTENANLLITASLDIALRYLRRDDGQSVTLWADAVCINQRDVEERSFQVSLMPKIYAQATKIWVWLGTPTDRATASIQDAHEYTARYKTLARYPKGEKETESLHEPLLESGGGLLAESELFKYDYFRRTWVLQEVFNASNIIVLCGPHVLEWAQILRINQCLIKSMLIPNPVGKEVLPALLAGLFELVDDQSHPLHLSYKRLPGRLEILDVILRGLDLEASDVRDKIFALLTFGEETHQIEELPKSVRPDYSKSIAQVFADFTRWWIVSHKSLRILSAVQVAHGRTWQAMTHLLPMVEELDRPTWSLWHSGKSFWSRGTLGVSKECGFSAAGDNCLETELLTDPSDSLTLSLRGSVIDTIENINAYPWFIERHRAQRSPNAKKGSLDTLLAAYEHLLDPLDEWGTWRYGAQHEPPELQAYRRKNTAWEVGRKIEDHSSTHVETFRHTGAMECHSRCFFRTAGHEEGLCPPAAREQDLVVVLHGGDVPYILRPRRMGFDEKQEYYFIGECYLQGYMHGRVKEDTKGGGQQVATQIFHLI